jgi:uncharacterized protein
VGTLLAALCLVLVIEGLLLFVSPAGWKRIAEQAMSLPDSTLRRVGAGMIIVGLILLQLLRM